MSRIPTINDKWKSFEKMVMDPIDAPKVQRIEMKRAFFAGFDACLVILANEVSPLPENEGVDALESFHQQIRGFVVALEEGAA